MDIIKKIFQGPLFSIVGLAYITYITLTVDLPYFIRRKLGQSMEEEVIRANPRTKKICIFILYQKSNIPKHVLTQLHWIKKLGYDIHIISHTSLTDKKIEALRPYCFRLTKRPNVGYDFGGYKYGVLDFLRHHKETATHLLIANDSVFFPIKDPTELYNYSDSKKGDFWSFSENWEIHHHLPSYFLVFKESAFKSEAFHLFWKEYIPFSNRKHAIDKGEVKLTQNLKKVGLYPQISIDSNELYLKLKNKNEEELYQLFINKKAYDMNLIKLFEKYSFDIRKISIVRDTMNIMENYNISHHSFLVINKLTSFPILKKDIVYKNILDINLLIDNIEIEEETGIKLSEINQFYKMRGKITEKHNWFKRILAAKGYH